MPTYANRIGDSAATMPPGRSAHNPSDEEGECCSSAEGGAASPPSLLCSTAGSSDEQQMHHQPQQLPQHHPPAVCDDSSYFDGGWVSDTVQSAVTRFFGGSAEDAAAAASSASADGQGQARDADGSTTPQLMPPSDGVQALTISDNDSSITNENAGSHTNKNPIDNANPAIDTTTNGSSNDDHDHESHSLASRARSLTPSSLGRCGFDYDRLTLNQCDAGPADAVAVGVNDDGGGADAGEGGSSVSIHANEAAAQHRGGDENEALEGVEQRNNSSNDAEGYRPYFSPSDFQPSTWIDALHDTQTIKYCGAGAAGGILTAALVIHPVAMMGAAAVSAVAGASAMWAVGFFHELDGGYQIWNEDFGLLFWEDAKDKGDEDEDERRTGQGSLLEPRDGVQNTDLGEGSKVVVKLDEGSGVVESATTEGESSMPTIEDEVGAASKVDDIKAGEPLSQSSRESKMPQHQQHQQQHQRQHKQPKKGGYMLRRIKSAPVKVGLLSTTSASSRPLSPTETPPSTLPMRHRIKRPPLRGSAAKAPSLRPPLISPESATAHFTGSTSISPSTASATMATTETTRALIGSHFPPLEVCVVRDVELLGLNASEFFDVFFADDAPYSLRDFQKRRGDVDIVYGKWEAHGGDEEGRIMEDEDDGQLYSFKSGHGCAPSAPLPPNTTRQRKLKFSTLTRSYFGPAYAKATKTQRATRLSDRVLVIENITQLADIPFSDRFRVMERWVVEVVENDGHERHPQASTKVSDNANSGDKRHLQTPGTDDALYSTSCRLSVHAEVQLLKPCTWESQIRKKARETFTEVLNEWCRSATTALRATEEQKRRRLVQKQLEEQGCDDGYSDVATVDAGSSSNQNEPLSPTSAREKELFEKHQRNFQELDRLVAKGELDLSIEVVHSLPAGRGSAFARVLEHGECEFVGLSAADEDGGVGEVDGSRRMSASVIMRGKGRKLFKKLSSRVSKSRLR